MKKIVVFVMATLALAQFIFCCYAGTRRFALIEKPRDTVTEGWLFMPDIGAFWDVKLRNVPPDNVNGFIFHLYTYCKKEKPGTSINTIDIDSVLMTFVETGEHIVWQKYENYYSNVSADSFLNHFTFVNSISNGLLYIPPEIDTIRLELNAKFNKGVYKQYWKDDFNKFHDRRSDTIIVDTNNSETFYRQVTLLLIRKESKMLVPDL